MAFSLRRTLYEEGGLEKIQEIDDPGPEPGQESIPKGVMEVLKKRLAEPEGFGSYTEIQQWLAEEQGVELPYSTGHGIVRYELGAKPESPRPSHPKNQKEQVEFREEFPAALRASREAGPCVCFAKTNVGLD